MKKSYAAGVKKKRSRASSPAIKSLLVFGAIQSSDKHTVGLRERKPWNT